MSQIFPIQYLYISDLSTLEFIFRSRALIYISRLEIYYLISHFLINQISTLSLTLTLPPLSISLSLYLSRSLSLFSPYFLEKYREEEKNAPSASSVFIHPSAALSLKQRPAASSMYITSSRDVV